MKQLIISISFFSIFFFHPVSATEPLINSDIELFKKLMNSYVELFKTGKTEQWTDLFAADAVALHHGSPTMIGKDDIRTFVQDFANQYLVGDMQVSIEDVRIKGDWALIWGNFEEEFIARDTTSNTKQKNIGRYLLLWERQEDNQWKIIADMGNRGSE